MRVKIVLISLAIIVAACEIGGETESVETTNGQDTTTTLEATMTSEATTTTLSNEDLFLASILNASYTEGGTMQGIPVHNIVEANLVEYGNLWCDSVGTINEGSGTDQQKAEARNIAKAALISDMPASDAEVALIIYAAAESFLCP